MQEWLKSGGKEELETSQRSAAQIQEEILADCQRHGHGPIPGTDRGGHLAGFDQGSALATDWETKKKGN